MVTLGRLPATGTVITGILVSSDLTIAPNLVRATIRSDCRTTRRRGVQVIIRGEFGSPKLEIRRPGPFKETISRVLRPR